MDNAAKALIMAGGVFIAVMIVGLAIYILNGARGFASAANDQAELSAIESFNRYYQSFDSTITGIDALNIYNKAIDDSTRANHTHTVTVSIDSSIINQLNAPDGYNYMTNKYSYSYTFDSDGYIDNITIR